MYEIKGGFAFRLAFGRYVVVVGVQYEKNRNPTTQTSSSNESSFSSNFLEELRRGSLTEQFLMVKRKDGSRVKRGAYALLTRKHGRRTVSLRLTDPALVPLYRQQIQALRQFETVGTG